MTSWPDGQALQPAEVVVQTSGGSQPNETPEYRKARARALTQNISNHKVRVAESLSCNGGKNNGSASRAGCTRDLARGLRLLFCSSRGVRDLGSGPERPAQDRPF